FGRRRRPRPGSPRRGLERARDLAVDGRNRGAALGLLLPRRAPPLGRQNVELGLESRHFGEVLTPRELLVEHAELLALETDARKTVHAAFAVVAQRHVRAALAVGAVRAVRALGTSLA